ncbi:metallophosphoesterase [Enorma massiliensis]|uniref:metallophosphoesterase family protein n=1 Tax=Enorma massiliensis TaxID=1472761 RepID=UPI00195CB7BA|nr:metallophosphoesterase family protein [Enorma massiliensis]MBM6892902.1 metallophosphoesterase [Enorma massiliensis]
MCSPTTRTLVVGDMHLKEDAVFAGVDRAIAQIGVERVAFCGDYLDEWHAGTIAYHDGVDALLRWVKRRRSEGVAVDVVLGNHDMQYVFGEPGPGTLMSLVPVARAALGELKAVAAAVVGDALVTHAGVTGAWARQFLPRVAPGHGEESSAAAVCDALNALLDAGDQKSLYALASAGPARGGLALPGPLWADRTELLDDPLPGINQIVGHTPVASIELWNMPAADGEHTAERLVFCDTFSLSSHLAPMGDGSMLLIEDRAVSAIEWDSLGLASWPEHIWDWTIRNPFFSGVR